MMDMTKIKLFFSQPLTKGVLMIIGGLLIGDGVANILTGVQLGVLEIVFGVIIFWVFCFSLFPLSETKQEIPSVDRRLNDSGLEFRKTNLGQAAFVPLGTTGKYADKIFFPDEFTIAQLRAMADYMEENPNCTIFSDGSGKPCK